MNLVSSLFHEAHKLVVALPSAVPSTSTPRYVSLKNYSRMAAIIMVKNATTVTGSAITLKQAKNVSAGSEKSLSFSTVQACLDTADSSTGDTLTETAVSSDTFTTNSTNSKSLLYVINVDSTMLDVANGFDCVRVGTGDATAATVTVLYILYPVTGNPAPVAITN